MRTALGPAGAGLGAGIGEIVASADRRAVISALGLGSCVGVVLADPRAGVAGMAHVMLPASRPGAAAPPGRFADTAVPALLDQVLRLGGDRDRLEATIAGGAQMFGGGAGGGMLNIGGRNAEAVRAALKAAGLRVRAAEVGGSAGRSMQVAVDGGTVTVRAVGGGVIRL